MREVSVNTPGGGSATRTINTSLAVFACLLWSSDLGVMKITLQYCSPLTLLYTRYILAGVLLIPFWPGKIKTLATIRRSWRFMLVACFLYIIVGCGVFTFAMQWAKGAQAAVIIGAAPLIASVMAHFLMPDDKMDLAKLGVIFMGLLGMSVIIFSSNPLEPTGLTELIGMGLVLFAMASGSVTQVLLASRRRQVNPILLSSMQMMLGGFVFLVVAVSLGKLPETLPPPKFFIAVSYQAAISAGAHTIWFFLLRRMKVSQLCIWQFLIPVFGTIFAWLLAPGEQPSLVIAVGMVLVATAVLINASRMGPVPSIEPVDA